jgi:glutamate--cysteine ligase
MLPLATRLALLSGPSKAHLLTGITRGIEKESLRVQANGRLANSPHPKELGSALTHPSITTDYSEALLEFITAPSSSIEQVLNELNEIHRVTYQHIGDELLWVSSMPCQLGDDSSIPIADYGSSNIGTMKKVYRVGLGNRYGRLMQTIAGIHYNFSVPDELWLELQSASNNKDSLKDFKTAGYFALIRNFRRYSWLLLYLFGSAPAVCKSFVRGRQHDLVPVGDDSHSLHSPYATSLRMGDLGYQSNAQSSLVVCYNSLDQYIATLREALDQPYPAYDAIGLKDADGNYRQLSTHLLQIENEFYSAIRPKRTAGSGETPLHALEQGGVEYIEVRCVDLNPLVAAGIDESTIQFLDTFLLFCLLEDSPETNNEEYARIPQNNIRTVYQGRDPSLHLLRDGSEVTLRDWGHELMASLEPIASLLDKAHNSDTYSEVLTAMEARIEDASSTPAAILLREMADNNETYYGFAMRKAREQRDHFLQWPPTKETADKYRDLAQQSIWQQTEIESNDKLPFGEFLANYR